MRNRRIFTIEIHKDWVGKAVAELNAWGVSPDKYTLEGNVLTTQSGNVVDVLTETFMDAKHLIVLKG
jgi:hypothetical protein